MAEETTERTSHLKKYMNNDKKTECLRYDARAQSLLVAGTSTVETAPVPGSLAVPPIYRAPYIYYEQSIRRHITQDHDVLELGSGTGLHTYALAQTGARVVASDISSHSLGVLSQRIGGVTTQVADMESLPFEDNSFHVVTCAVSYLMPVLARIIGQDRAAKVSDAVDRRVHMRRAAFKFVLVARGRL